MEGHPADDGGADCADPAETLENLKRKRRAYPKAGAALKLAPPKSRQTGQSV